MSLPLLLFLACLLGPAARPASAQKVSSGTLRFALIEDAPSDVNMRLTLPLEQVLRSEAGRAELLDMETLPAYTADGDYRFRLPAAPVEVSTGPAVALETDTETALVYPPIPSFLERFARAAREPESYRAPWNVHLSSRTLTLFLGRGRDRETVVTAMAQPGRGEAARWQSTAAAVFHIRWEGRDVSVAVIGRVFAGLGKLSSAVSAERAKGPLLGVARGGVFGGYSSEVEGRALADRLEAMGLAYSAAAGSELRFWKETAAYRAERPDGIQFLSLNLVYSSAPAASFMPGWAIVPFGGLKVAVVGLTPLSAGKYLNLAGLGHLKVADPLQVLETNIARIRREADCVVVLLALDPEEASVMHLARGADLILGEQAGGPDQAPRGRTAQASQRRRADYDTPLWTAKAYAGALTVVEAEVSAGDGRSDWLVRERQVRLDETVPNAPGLPEFEPESYGIAFTTAAPLIPSAQVMYPGGLAGRGFARVGRQEFWTMAAAILAGETRSEIGLTRVTPLASQIVGDIPEEVVRSWVRTRADDAAITLRLRGSMVKALIAEAEAQARAEAAGVPQTGRTRFTVAGYGPGPTVHGAPIEDQQVYRVATSRIAADALDLIAGGDPRPVGQTVGQVVLDGLRKRSGSEPATYRSWIEGRSVEERGLWRLNFREVGLRVHSTRVVRDDAFDAVPNSRIQGFDEFLLGGVFKADADWLKDTYKWSNTMELEYAQSHLTPRNSPPVTNTTANRILALTSGTRRVGSIETQWLARSWGPSLGFQYEGQFEPTPGLKRKTIYSAFPGVEFYDGSVVRKLYLAANVKRDFSRDPPNTQYGLYSRMLASHAFGAAPAPRLDAEAFANYFFRAKTDQDQDLRFEGDVVLRLNIPIRSYLTIAPFIDFYAYALKTKPLWGYSSMLGLSIGFSRLWKPQYEPF